MVRKDCHEFKTEFYHEQHEGANEGLKAEEGHDHIYILGQSFLQ